MCAFGCGQSLARFAGPSDEWLVLPNWPAPVGGIWQAPAREPRPRGKKATQAVIAPITVRCPKCEQVSDIGRAPTMNELLREQIVAAREARTS
jgi:hypothetical protein